VKKALDWFKGLSKLGKVGVIIGVIILYMIGTAAFMLEENSNTPKKEAVEEVAEEIVEEKKVPKYEIVEEEDISYSAIKRLRFRVVVSKNITKEEVGLIAKDIVRKTIDTQDVNAISVAMYDKEEDAQGGYTVAMVEWVPGGDWGKAGDVETGDYSTHEYNINYKTIQNEKVVEKEEEPKEEVKEEPKESLEETAYIIALAKQSSEWSNTFQQFGELLEYPRMGEDDWTMQAAAQIVQMRMLCDDANELTPPDKYKESHELYMKAVNEYNWVATNFPTAIDNLDVDMINECSERTLKGNDYINQSAKIIDEM